MIQLQLEKDTSDGDIFLSALRTSEMNRARTPKIELQVTCKRFSVDLSLTLEEAAELGAFLQEAAEKGKEGGDLL